MWTLDLSAVLPLLLREGVAKTALSFETVTMMPRAAYPCGCNWESRNGNVARSLSGVGEQWQMKFIHGKPFCSAVSRLPSWLLAGCYWESELLHRWIAQFGCTLR